MRCKVVIFPGNQKGKREKENAQNSGKVQL